MIEINIQYDPPLNRKNKNYYYALINLSSIDVNNRDLIIKKIKDLRSGSAYIKTTHYSIQVKDIYRYNETCAEMTFYVIGDRLEEDTDLVFHPLKQDLIYADKLILLKEIQ